MDLLKRANKVFECIFAIIPRSAALGAAACYVSGRVFPQHVAQGLKEAGFVETTARLQVLWVNCSPAGRRDLGKVLSALAARAASTTVPIDYRV